MTKLENSSQLDIKKDVKLVKAINTLVTFGPREKRESDAMRAQVQVKVSRTFKFRQII